VLGLDREFYITDHHHLGLALLQEGVKEVWVTKLDDMSWLEPQIFWRTLEFRGWAHSTISRAVAGRLPTCPENRPS
jgi:hypothetical protein